jgi:hypothetical protein
MTRYLSLLFILTVFSLNALGDDKPEATKTSSPKTSEAKPTAPKNTTGDRKFESTITAIDTTGALPKITLKNGAMTLELKPDTEVVREERDLVASDLKVGDAVCFTALKGARSKLSIKEKAVVTKTEPLMIRIGDAAEMTFLKTDLWEFYRAVPLKTSDLKVGQTIAVQIRLQHDGDIATKRVAVVIGKPQATKTRRKTVKSTTAETGNKAG